MRFSIIATAIVIGALASSATDARAHEDEPKNLKVLKATKTLEDGMKEMTKGLGVKCDACHIKADFASDKLPAKVAARAFLSSALGEKDQAKRDAALKTLLEKMRLPKARKPAQIWKALTYLTRK